MIDDMKKYNLLVIGTLPEVSGVGGVTIHVKRLMDNLRESGVCGVELCDYKTIAFINQFWKIIHSKIVHIHVSNPYLKLIYVLIARIFNTKSIITLHGKYGIYGKWKNRVHKISLKWCDVPILINEESFNSVLKINARARYMSAFIRPDSNQERLPYEFEEKLNRIKKSGRKVFATNASSRAFTYDGQEIYGIDFLISFFTKHSEYVLIILDPSNQYTFVYADKLPENIILRSDKLSFCGLVKESDAIIRNTVTDGDSMSVKEALFFHCPVLATDVVTRPEGTILFRYNDEASLEYGITKLFSSNSDFGLNEPDAMECYMKLYHHLGIRI